MFITKYIIRSELFSNIVSINRYGIALCEMVGFTCTGKNFCIAYAFMSHEDIPSYEWVLNQLKIILGPHVPEAIMTDRELGLIQALPLVFPNVQHMLCWVHITRKCENKAFKVTGSLELAAAFKNNCWGLFCSSSEETYEIRRRALYAGWSHYPLLMPYLQTTWLRDHKTSIIRCWTDRAMHFGTRTTNRYFIHTFIISLYLFVLFIFDYFFCP